MTADPHEPGTRATPGLLLANRYKLVEPIANGGMAQVWKATDTVLGRSVAVKILHPHLATDEAFVLRFRREAVAAARLSHPAIVSIYDTMSTPAIEAIVMELVEGRTLRTVLDEVKILSSADAVDLGIQIADALDEAHRAGIVHRDIKPSNILLCPDRRVMVTDFGIAKAGEDTDLTVTGTLLGTAKYLSPEQVRGDNVDPRSDLYSLGVVMFESLAGRAPFKADTDAATALARLQRDPPRLQGINPDVPTALENVIDKLMEREPEARFERAVDVRAALTGIQLGPNTADETLLVAQPLVLEQEGSEVEGASGDLHGFIRSERGWILPAFVLLLVAVGLVVAGLLISQSPIADRVLDLPSIGGDDTPDDPGEDAATTDTTTLTSIEEVGLPTLATVSDLDPEGDGTERPETVPFAHDGDRSTFWRTERYRSANYGNLKSGVGLLVDLGGMAQIEEITMETNTSGWSVQFYVGSDFSGDPASWGAPVFEAADLTGDNTFALEEAIGASLVIWITDPGVSSDGDDDDTEPDHRFELAELRLS